MANPKTLQEIETLPPEAPKLVSEFVAFLKTRYGVAMRKKTKLRKLEDEPFIGMWKDRVDLRFDSTINAIRKTYSRVSEDTVMADVIKATKEVRKSRKSKRGSRLSDKT
jgi:hypothetical protein